MAGITGTGVANPNLVQGFDLIIPGSRGTEPRGAPQFGAVDQSYRELVVSRPPFHGGHVLAGIAAAGILAYLGWRAYRG